jgi:spermidine/putrescine-binding protein
MRMSEAPQGAATTRRDFLALSAVAGASAFLSACGSSGSGDSSASGAATLPWLTWSDHYVPGQLQAVGKLTKVTLKPTLIGDNAPTLLKVKTTGGQFGVVSGDALWLPKYFKAGLTQELDLDAISTTGQLYSSARDSQLFRSGSSVMGFPFGWSTKPIYFNPKYVTTKPTSYEALLSPKYRKRIVLESDPLGVLTVAGLATGAAEPFNMNPGEIADAKEFMRQMKPNMLKFVSQAQEVTRALANGSAWLGMGNLGLDAQVRDSGGPKIDFVIAKEGTYGFIDAEQSIKKSNDLKAFERWMAASYDAKWVAQNFLKNGRPLFNEKAYKLLVNQGHKEQADRLLYNQPDRAFEQKLLGPVAQQQAYSDAFNEIFGA